MRVLLMLNLTERLFLLGEYLTAYATIISGFLINKEKASRNLRYIFKGFELGLVQEVSRILAQNYSTKIPVIGLYENYERAIKSRASDKPILIWIAGRKVGEYSSLSSTLKSITNVFYPFQKRWERVEGIYDLYDISVWLFQQDKLEYVANEFFGKKGYLAKRGVLERTFVILKSFWNSSATNPSLRNRLTPGVVAKILAGISSSQDFDFNDLVQAIGFEPSLAIHLDETSVETFFSNSKKLVRYLKGSDPDKRSKFARLCENIIAGLLFYHLKTGDPKTMAPKNLGFILRLYKEKDEKGRRVWIVRSTDVEIKEYSLISGLVKRILFRVRNRKTNETYIFDDDWNQQLAAGEGLSLFLKFLKDQNFVGTVYEKSPPFKFTARKDEIEVIFNSLEGYLFGLKAFRKELDEIQI